MNQDMRAGLTRLYIDGPAHNGWQAIAYADARIARRDFDSLRPPGHLDRRASGTDCPLHEYSDEWYPVRTASAPARKKLGLRRGRKERRLPQLLADAVARPIPLDAPVTSAVLFWSVVIVFSIGCR